MGVTHDALSVLLVEGASCEKNSDGVVSNSIRVASGELSGVQLWINGVFRVGSLFVLYAFSVRSPCVLCLSSGGGLGVSWDVLRALLGSSGGHLGGQMLPQSLPSRLW